MKKVLSIFLSIILAFTVAPVTAFANSSEGLISGQEYQCGDFTYKYDSENGHIELCDVSDTLSGDVVIPATLDGYSITSIAMGAFGNIPNITSITIPNTVTLIEDSSIFGCEKLKTVYIPASVTEIKSPAISSNCINLENILLIVKISIILRWMVFFIVKIKQC